MHKKETAVNYEFNYKRMQLMKTKATVKLQVLCSSLSCKPLKGQWMIIEDRHGMVAILPLILL